MKFSLDWLGDFLDTAAAGGAEGVARLLEQAGIPMESAQRSAADTVFDFEITPNRPDAMSHRGLAREVAAMSGVAMTTIRPGGAPPADGPPASSFASVTIEVPRLCRRFAARVVRDVSAAPASASVRARLAAIGAKSISAAVDATNYVLWEVGQPLHAFDLDKVAGGQIFVRRAHKGEKLVLLDGVEYALDASDVVVADRDRAISLAGIMGGLDTAVSASTRHVLLEAAWWEPVAIRRTARRLGLHTDASHRFERGADPEAPAEALDRAARLLLESAGGTLAPGLIDARGLPWKPRRASLRLARLKLLAGDARLDLDFAEQALTRLGFPVSRRGKRLAVEIPSWRVDISIEDDLVEEVLRVYGYQQLPSTLPPTRGGGRHLEPLRVVEERLSDVASGSGLLETMSTPFVNRRIDEGPYTGWLEAAGCAPRPLSLANPLDDGRRDLRATLLPGLLDALARNVHRGERTIGLFEVGRVFDRAGNPEDPPSFESRRFAFAVAGDWRAHWSASGAAGRLDFYDAKGILERLLEPWVQAESLEWKDLPADSFVEGAAARVELAGSVLGVVAQVSSAERERRKLSGPVFAGEIRVDALPINVEPTHFTAYSSLPPIEADLSFAHRRDISWQTIRDFVVEKRLTDLESVRILDRYEGQSVEPRHVRTTIRLTFRSSQKTLQQEDVNREVARVREGLIGHLGATFD